MVAQREKEEIEGLSDVAPEDREIIEAERLRAAADETRSRVLDVTLLNADGKPQNNLRAGEPMRVRIRYRLAERVANPGIACEIVRNDGLVMFGTNSYEHGLHLGNQPLETEVAFEVPYLGLNEGNYTMRLKLYLNAGNENWYYYPEDITEDACKFRVSAGEAVRGCTYMSTRWEAESRPGATAISALETNR